MIIFAACLVDIVFDIYLWLAIICLMITHIVLLTIIKTRKTLTDLSGVESSSHLHSQVVFFHYFSVVFLDYLCTRDAKSSKPSAAKHFGYLKFSNIESSIFPQTVTKYPIITDRHGILYNSSTSQIIHLPAT